MVGIQNGQIRNDVDLATQAAYNQIGTVSILRITVILLYV